LFSADILVAAELFPLCVRFVRKIPPFANLQTIIGHFKRRHSRQSINVNNGTKTY
jgi:hypothetical protein